MSDVPPVSTPYDHPSVWWERLIFPALRNAYREGWGDGSKATVDTLIELGFRK